MRNSVLNLSVISSLVLTGVLSSISNAGTLYAIRNTTELYEVNTLNAALTSVGSYANDGAGETIAYNPDSGLIHRWTGDNTRFRSTIDPGNGFTQSPLTIDGFDEISSATWDSTNDQFILTTIYYDWATMPASGGITHIDTTDTVVRGLAFVGSTLYGLEHFDDLDGDGFVDLLTLDPATGDVLNDTEINIPSYTGDGAFGLAYDPDTDTLYAALGTANVQGNRFLASIDPTTGDGTVIGGFSQLGINSLTVIPTVPEPTTLALLAAGSVLTIRRKR